MDRLTFLVGFAVTAIPVAEYAGLLTVDRTAPAVAAYGALLMGLAVASRQGSSRVAAQRLLRVVIAAGFLMATFAARPHAARFGVIATVLLAYVLAQDEAYGAVVIGASYVAAGVLAGFGLAHATHPFFDAEFGVALLALGFLIVRQALHRFLRPFAATLVTAAFVTGLSIAGLGGPMPAVLALAIHLSARVLISDARRPVQAAT